MERKQINEDSIIQNNSLQENVTNIVLNKRIGLRTPSKRRPTKKFE